MKNFHNFPQPSTDDRKDFEVNIPQSKMIVFKSPSLTFATIEKKELKDILNNIIENLGLNFNLLMSKSDKKETQQKITLLKNFNKRLDTAKKRRKKTDIEKQLHSHEWLKQLVEDQLKDKTSYNFDENCENRKFKNKFP